MTSRARPRLRHCPLCSVAMQGRKSQAHLPEFDIFECQTCDTVIRETARPAGTPGDKLE